MSISRFETRSPNLLETSYLTPQKERFSPTFPQKPPKCLLSLYFSVTQWERPLCWRSWSTCVCNMPSHSSEHACRMFPWSASVRRDDRRHLFFGDHVISEDADVADLDFDGVARDHIAVSSLGAHPEYVARVEGRVPAQLLNPGRRIPDLVG